MGAFSILHWIIVLIVIIVLFGGRGRISSIMSDVGKGFRSLKKELEGKDNENDNKK